MLVKRATHVPENVLFQIGLIPPLSGAAGAELEHRPSVGVRGHYPQQAALLVVDDDPRVEHSGVWVLQHDVTLGSTASETFFSN